MIRQHAPYLLMACALAIGSSTSWAASDDHDGDKGCSTHTLHGAYGLTIEGLVAIPGPGIQIRGVVLQTFDGNGGLTQVDHVVIGGAPSASPWTAGTGTYSVNPDCTGKATIITSAGAPPLVVYFVITDDGKGISQVVDGNAVIATGRRLD